MIKKVESGSAVWIDLKSPSSEELSGIAEQYGLDSFTVSELLSKSVLSGVRVYDNYIYVILHFAGDVEVDFVIGSDFIITVRYQNMETINELRKIYNNPNSHLAPAELFYKVVGALYSEIEDQLIILRSHIKYIEESVYSGKEKEMVVELAKSGKNLLDMQMALEPHKEVIDSLSSGSMRAYDKNFKRNMILLQNKLYELNRRVIRLTALQEELRATNDSLLSVKQNTIMQMFTIIAFVTLIPALITSIFGMNTKYMPLINHKYDFWLVILLMIIASVSVFAFFKHKKWL